MDSHTQEKLMTYLDHALGAIQTQMPAAKALLLGVTQINALVELEYGLICLIFALVFGLKLLPWAIKGFKEADYKGYEPWLIGVISFVVGTVMTGLIALINLFDIWAWIGVFNPTLALAHQILDKVLSST